MANILIVDDSSLIRSVATDATKEAGHEPVVAENGEEGLKKLEEMKIDLIFSDVNMPVIPIVMLTTESNPALKEKGKSLGVKAWMLKPFSKEKFFMAVQKLIS